MALSSSLILVIFIVIPKELLIYDTWEIGERIALSDFKGNCLSSAASRS